jgi:Uma2 family endonuclease
MNTIKEKLTAEDLLKIPYDGFRYELIQGELLKMSPAAYTHGKIAMNIGASLHQFVKSNKLGEVCVAETGFKLASEPDTVRAPDVAFIRKERIEKVGILQGFGRGAPDLIVEVTSPSDTFQEVDDKVGDWLDAGVLMVIIINPCKKRVHLYRSKTNVAILDENDEIDGEDVVPGWKIKVSELFE